MSDSDYRLALNLRYAQLTPKFLELRCQELPALSDALAREDFKTLSRLGHNLHGSGAGYGLETVSRLGAQLEEAARKNDFARARNLCEEYGEFLDRVRITYRNSILFVDDQPEILSLLKRLFPEGEYICHYASSAAQALQLLEDHPIDVLVSDLVMPEMGGLELLSIVRETYPDVVRLVLSGQSQVPSILAAINTGQVFRYLTKPWRVDAQARAIIAEAVAHANAQNKTESPCLQLEPAALSLLLEATGKDYVVTGRAGRIIATSAALRERCPIGAVKEPDLGASARRISLDASHTAYILA